MQGVRKMEWMQTDALDAGVADRERRNERLEKSLRRFEWLPSEPALVEVEPGGHCVVLDGRERVHLLREINKERGKGEKLQVPCAIMQGEAAQAAAVARSFGAVPEPWEIRTTRLLEYLGEEEKQRVQEVAALIGTHHARISQAVESRRLIREGSEGGTLKERMKNSRRMGAVVTSTPSTWQWWLTIGARTDEGEGPKDEGERKKRLQSLLETVFGKDPELDSVELRTLGTFIERGGKMEDVRRLGGLREADKALDSPMLKATRATYAIQDGCGELRSAIGKADSYEGLAQCAKLLGDAYNNMQYAWNALGRRLAAGAPKSG